MLNNFTSLFANSSTKSSETSDISGDNNFSTPSSKTKRQRESSVSPEAETKRNREKSPGMDQTEQESLLENLMDKYEERMKILINGSEERNAKLIKDGLKPIADMVNKITQIECKIERTNQILQSVQKAERKNNIIVFGLPDSKTETYNEREKVIEGLSNSLKLQKLDYSDAFRLGIKTADKNRPLLIKLVRYTDKVSIMRACKNLKGTAISIDDDNTPEERKAKSELYRKMKEVLKHNPDAACKVNPLRLIVRSGGKSEIWKYDPSKKEVVRIDANELRRRSTQMDQDI
jgi:hypothetical protein